MVSEHPPSYESVVAKLDKLVGPNPTPQKVLDIARTLSQGDIDVLVDDNDKLPPWTEEMQSVFSIGVATEMSSPDAVPHLQAAADAASSAYQHIEEMFTKLVLELSAIDSKNMPPPEDPFAPRLAIFHADYRKTVAASTDLAVKIAVHLRRFDEVIIPLANDSTYTIERRKEKLDEFIKDGDGYSKEAEATTEGFSAIRKKFANFISSFDNWAKDKEEEDQKKLKRARKELADLNDKLAKLQTALSSLGAISAAVIPATGAIAGLSGTFAPFVIVGGLILAGITIAATVGLYAAIQSCKSEISSKEGEIRDLEEEVDQIKKDRATLHQLGEKYLHEFDTSISTVSSVWATANYDAKRVKEWLEDGANQVDMPVYMKASIDHEITIYATMADYLDWYADGIKSTST